MSHIVLFLSLLAVRVTHAEEDCHSNECPVQVNTLLQSSQQGIHKRGLVQSQALVPSTYNPKVISNGFYCGKGSGVVDGFRWLRTINGDETKCKEECGKDENCKVFSMPFVHMDYECRGSPLKKGPCCVLVDVANAPREAASNTICPNSQGGYARAANSYNLWAKKTQGTYPQAPVPSTYNPKVISNGFYCGKGSGVVDGYRWLRTINGDETKCKEECGKDENCKVFSMPFVHMDYECRGSPLKKGPCCVLVDVANAPREAASNTICPNSQGGYARAANSYNLWAKKTQGTYPQAQCDDTCYTAKGVLNPSKQCGKKKCTGCCECAGGECIDKKDLEDDEKEDEVADEEQITYACKKWCYSKKHKSKPWQGKKCGWYDCSTCPECD